MSGIKLRYVSDKYLTRYYSEVAEDGVCGFVT